MQDYLQLFFVWKNKIVQHTDETSSVYMVLSKVKKEPFRLVNHLRPQAHRMNKSQAKNAIIQFSIIVVSWGLMGYTYCLFCCISRVELQ